MMRRASSSIDYDYGHRHLGHNGLDTESDHSSSNQELNEYYVDDDSVDEDASDVYYRGRYRTPSVTFQRQEPVRHRSNSAVFRRSELANSKILDLYTNQESCSIHDKHKTLSNEYDDDEEFEPDEENSKLSYCYLCSIKAHVHKKTEPVPVHKRRYLKPYTNPMQLVKRYFDDQGAFDLKTKYLFSVKTGSKNLSGTNANVWFKLHGAAGNWGKAELRCLKKFNEMRFPTDSLIEFTMEGPVIGDLKRLQLWHDAKSARDGWFLEYIEITNLKMKETWRFECNRWISKFRAPDFNASVILSLEKGDKPHLVDESKSAEYQVLIKTGPKSLKDSDRYDIYFQLIGADGQTNILKFVSRYVYLFDKHQLDAFLIKSTVDLGAPVKIRLAHQNLRTAQLWSVDEIKVIYSKNPKVYYVFRVEDWLERNGLKNALVKPLEPLPFEQSDSPTSNKVIYYVSVITGNHRMAGTDAHVFIEIHGTKGVTAQHRLHNSKAKREFHRNHMSHFHVFDIDVGNIKYIRIWHDNSGAAPGWFLDAVLIKCMNTVISGDISKHDAELRDQLKKLCQKIKDRDKLENERRAKSEERSYSRESERAEGAEPPPIAKRRSVSAESAKSEQSEVDREKATPSPASAAGKPKPKLKAKRNKKLVKQRSVSSDSLNKEDDADLDPASIPEAGKPVVIDHKEILKRTIKPKTDKRNRASPSPSILKTSASPRNRSESAKKQVKFDGKDQHHHEPPRSRSNSPPSQRGPEEKRHAPRIDIDISWLLTVLYEPQGQVDKIISLDHFDRSLQTTKPAAKDAKVSKLRTSRRTGPAVVDARPKTAYLEGPMRPLSPGHKPINHEDYIYVFECKRWLAKDQEDGHIERALKPTALLKK